ncbi:MAG: SPOR domain-containing protein [Flavobacteriales bacterium]
MRIASTLLFLSLFGPLSAQDDLRLFRPANASADSNAQIQDSPRTRASIPTDSVIPGTIKVVESERIKSLMANYATKKQSLKGYRVQIFLGDRATAENTRRAFLLQYPDTPAYLSYLAPNFRVRVGDLRDRIAAEYLRESLKGEFPGLYVVPDEIEPPRLSKANTDKDTGGASPDGKAP